MQSIFFEITIVIFLAAVLSIVFRFFKQPSILAFILTGIIIGPFGPIRFESHELMQSLASIGITLLLFMIGLELNIKELKSVGKNALVIGILQILLTSIFGFGISELLGFSDSTSLYLGIALALSSTILVVKLLSDKRDLKSLYGKISIGILLVQDITAIFILIILSTFNSPGSTVGISELLVAGLKVVVLFGWVILLSREILPKLLNIISRSSESLFLFSLAWVFGISALVASPFIGFSIEIGGLLAGIALATSIESYQIVTKIKPLRDFFLTIFFVTLGMEITLNNFSEIFIPSLVFSAFVLFISPVILMGILGFFKYTKRTSFFTGVALAQISEFSLIMIYLGNKIGHLTSEIVSIITFVGAITFVFSTYFITQCNSLYKFFSPYLDFFERNKTKTDEKDQEISNHIILVGANRMGDWILEALLKKKEEIMVVDFDPDIIEKLNKRHVHAFFGDISDPDIQKEININKSSLIISTISDPEDNLVLLKSIRPIKGPKIVVAAFEKSDARDFYREGADYVIMPHFAGGHHLAKMLSEEDHLDQLEKYAEKEKSYIL